MSDRQPLLRSFTLRPALLLLALLCPALALAERDGGDEISDEEAYVDALGDDLALQREEIVEQMRPKGRYAELGREQLDQVVEGLDEMQAIVGDARDITELTPQQRADLLNVQEEVNTILTQARADSRIKCKRFSTVGTRLRKNTHCHTVAHWERLRTQSGQEVMERIRGDRTQKN